MYQDAIRPAWAEINLAHLDYNIKNIKHKVGDGVAIIGVIKADGYGHGSVRTAEVLRKNGVKTFAVATLSEAVKLREHHIREEIIVLGLTPDMYASTIVEYGITPVVCSLSNASAISRAAHERAKVVNGLIAVDTGMGRIGYLPDESNAVKEIAEMQNLSGFKIKGIFSHLAVADEADKSYTFRQEELFRTFCRKLTDAGVCIPMKTLANSAAVMELPSTYFDAVRPGIILYGCYPSDEVDKSLLALRPAMSVKATIVQLKTVPKGTTISYGRKYTAPRESIIATLALGYADGLPRPYSSKGRVIVNGRFAPIAGNICMDQCMIDVTDIPNVQVGDPVTIMGRDGGIEISADDIGKATGTINYEIICAFGQRLPKVYINEAERRLE